MHQLPVKVGVGIDMPFVQLQRDISVVLSAETKTESILEAQEPLWDNDSMSSLT